MEKHIFRTLVQGNPNVGLFGFANDNFCLVGEEFSDAQVKDIEEVLKVPVHRITMCGTSLVGVFVAGNNNVLLVPSIAFDYELKKLEELKINYVVIDSELTALGNNISCTDHGCLINKEFKPEQKNQIRDAVKVPMETGTVDNFNIVGSMISCNSSHGIVSRDISPEEKQVGERVLGIPLLESSVNIGSPHIHSGMFCNKNGFVISSSTTGPEITNIDEGLGFIE